MKYNIDVVETVIREIWKTTVGGAFLAQNLLIILTNPPQIVIELLSIYLLVSVAVLVLPNWVATWHRYMR